MGVALHWKFSLLLQFIFSYIITIHIIGRLHIYTSTYLSYVLPIYITIYLWLLILLALIVLIISTLLSYGIIYITLCFVTTIIIGSTIIIRVYSLAIAHIVDIVLI